MTAATPSLTLPAELFGTRIAVSATAPEIRFVREFAAPRELVWAAYTEPEHLMQWWGPEGFTCPTAAIDLRPGGTWTVTMRDPAGFDYPTNAVIESVEAPRRLVLTEIVDATIGEEWFAELETKRGADAGTPLTLTWDVTLDEDAAGTLMTIVTRYRNDADRAALAGMGMAEGLTQSLEKLARALAAREAGEGRA